GHIPVFECMVKHNWDINYSLDHRGDALICALKFHAPELARWLLEHGADPNANLGSDPLAGTALEVACSARCPRDIISLLIHKGADIEGSISMLVAAWVGHNEALSILLDGGADIDTIPKASSSDLLLEEYWGTPLHGAAAKGQSETVRFLLNKGARKDILNNAGRTPIETAEHFGHVACASIL
ncbi:ankyrin repeat-containing domain protein, partial [Coniella lustricola]